jgi:hypothetical protein
VYKLFSTQFSQNQQRFLAKGINGGPSLNEKENGEWGMGNEEPSLLSSPFSILHSSYLHRAHSPLAPK